MKFAARDRFSRMLIVEMTPMIDVVFLLIIFFMTTAQFARVSRAELELPKEAGEQDEAPEEAGLIINLLQDGSLIVNERTITIDELDDHLREAVDGAPGGDPGRVKLMIRADHRSNTAVLNEVLRRLEARGIPLARLATEVPG